MFSKTGLSLSQFFFLGWIPFLVFCGEEKHLDRIDISHVQILNELTLGPKWESIVDQIPVQRGNKKITWNYFFLSPSEAKKESWTGYMYGKYINSLTKFVQSTKYISPNRKDHFGFNGTICVNCHVFTQGELGNQLFKYANGRLKADYYGVGLHGLPRLFDPDASMCYSRKYFPYLFANAPPEIPSIEKKECLWIGSHKIYIANWYRDCRPNILEYFKFSDSIRSLLPVPGKNDVVVHLRGVDLHEQILGGTCAEIDEMPPFSYFDKILSQKRWEKVWLVGSVAGLDSKHGHYLREKYGAINSLSNGQNFVLEDFYFLSNANFMILGYGTFAWWAAFLSEAQEVHFPYCSYHPNMFSETNKTIPEDEKEWRLCGECWSAIPDLFVDYLPNYRYHEIIQKVHDLTGQQVLETNSFFARKVHDVWTKNPRHREKVVPHCPHLQKEKERDISVKIQTLKSHFLLKNRTFFDSNNKKRIK